VDFLKIKLIEYGFAAVAAPLAVLAVQLIKRYVSWVESLKEWPKRAFVTATVTVFVALGGVLGLDFGVTPDTESVDFLMNLDTNAIKVAIGSGLAFLLHALKKAVKK
jgi:hypothetical protein